MMSISGAVAELNKEIERLVEIRDSLSQTSSFRGTPAKKAVARKSARTKESSPAKKRTLSPAARKRISDAAKARWAAVKKATPAKKA
jgi:hypothetical protein